MMMLCWNWQQKPMCGWKSGFINNLTFNRANCKIAFYLVLSLWFRSVFKKWINQFFYNTAGFTLSLDSLETIAIHPVFIIETIICIDRQSSWAGRTGAAPPMTACKSQILLSLSVFHFFSVCLNKIVLPISLPVTEMWS